MSPDRAAEIAVWRHDYDVAAHDKQLLLLAAEIAVWRHDYDVAAHDKQLLLLQLTEARALLSEALGELHPGLRICGCGDTYSASYCGPHSIGCRIRRAVQR